MINPMTALERRFFPTDIEDGPDLIQRRLDCLASLHREGWQVRPFQLPKRRARRQLAGLVRGEFSAWNTAPGHERGIWDHSYRLVRADGQVIYVGEPYRLHEAGLDQIAEMRREGWTVEVRPDWALHYPGMTMAVWVRESVDSAA